MSNIIGFFGLMSSGKGVSSTRFLRKQIEKNPRKVIANCYLREKNFIQLTTDELYLKYQNPEFFDNSYLYMTELHTILDSRRTNSLMNTNFTMFLTQLGKRNCFVIYDSQLEGQIDIRMREFTPKRIICKRFIEKNGKWQKSDFGTDRKYNGRIAILEILNFTNIYGKEVFQPINIYIPTKEDFNYYHTEEVVLIDREKYLKQPYQKKKERIYDTDNLKEWIEI